MPVLDRSALEDTPGMDFLAAALLNLDTYGGGFTARALIFLTFWLISV